MPQELLYSTTLRLHGPWLLETKRLLALDDILGDGSENKKSLTIFLSEDRELKTSSFKEAMAHIGSQNEVAKGFDYAATMNNATASVQLLRKKAEKKGEHDEHLFEIKVSPPSETECYNIFVKLKDWADAVAAPL